MPTDEEQTEPLTPEEALKKLKQDIRESIIRSEQEDQDLLQNLTKLFGEAGPNRQNTTLTSPAFGKQLHRIKLVTAFINGCSSIESAIKFDWLVCGALDLDGEEEAQFIKDAWLQYRSGSQ